MDINIITVFILAIFVGFEIITKVPPTLHTPLMSGSNAISGMSNYFHYSWWWNWNMAGFSCCYFCNDQLRRWFYGYW